MPVRALYTGKITFRLRAYESTDPFLKYEFYMLMVARFGELLRPLTTVGVSIFRRKFRQPSNFCSKRWLNNRKSRTDRIRCDLRSINFVSLFLSRLFVIRVEICLRWKFFWFWKMKSPWNRKERGKIEPPFHFRHSNPSKR